MQLLLTEQPIISNILTCGCTEPTTSRDGHRAHFAVQSLDLLALASSGVGEASKDLGSLSGAVLHHLDRSHVEPLKS